MITVLDSQGLFAELLLGALAAEPDLSNTDLVGDPAQADSVMTDTRPDVGVLVASTIDPDIAALINRIATRHPTTPLVVVTTATDQLAPRLALRPGVDQWVPRTGTFRDIRTAVRSAGRRARSHLAARLVLPAPRHATASLVTSYSTTTLPRSARRDTTMAAGVRQLAPQGPGSLTLRERDVLGRLAAGCTATIIARQLSITPNTSRGHIKNLLRKLDAHSQLEALVIARRHGLIGPTSTRATVGPDTSP